jgi:abortive infection bacteriophage resistance protein
MSYRKPWLSYEDQLHKLIDRGMQVTNRARALDYLERVGYYRLSGYWYPFRTRQEGAVLDEFKVGSSFENAVELYVFDKRLRLLSLDALERIEVALRVDVSHTLGRIDQFAHLNASCLHETFAHEVNGKTGLTNHHQWVSRHAGLINRSKEDFIKHNKKKYGLPLPIWIACEVWDFGVMSTLYNGMKQSDQDDISSKYGVRNGRTFASWLRSLNYLRNVCAHHSRLWNRNIVDQPKKPGPGEAELFASAWDYPHQVARCFLLFCICQHLLQRICPQSSWWERFKQLLGEFPEAEEQGVSLEAMGVISGWPAWQWELGQ